MEADVAIVSDNRNKKKGRVSEKKEEYVDSINIVLCHIVVLAGDS